MTQLFDSHIHGDFPEVDLTIRSEQIAGFLIPAADPNHWQRVVDCAKRHDQPYALGVHPWWVSDDWNNWVANLPAGAHAIGETGLDALRGDFELQVASFQAHLALACARELPVIAHCVRAVPQLIEIIAQYPKSRGVVHAFNGNINQARQLIELGWFVGIGGLVTYPNNKRLREVVKQLKCKGMLLETDAPSLAPIDWPLEHNQATGILAVANSVSELCQLSSDEVAKITTANSKSLFGL